MYGRLSRLGVCNTQPAVNKLVRLCGKNHDHKIKVWKAELCNTNQHPIVSKSCSYVIVGDNIDKTRDMTAEISGETTTSILFPS